MITCNVGVCMYVNITGPFLPLQGTSSHETVIDTDSTDENIISSTGAVGAIEKVIY